MEFNIRKAIGIFKNKNNLINQGLGSLRNSLGIKTSVICPKS